MAKYSTGSGRGGDEGDACELCGRQSASLKRANVAGADLLVCNDCAPHGTQRRTESETSSRDTDGPSRKKRAAQQTAKLYDAQKGDTKHWEEDGTNYEKDRLPYLVSGYGDRLESARQDAGFTVDELAAELGADEADVLAIEQGRATRAGVGGSLVRALEELLDVELVDE